MLGGSFWICTEHRAECVVLTDADAFYVHCITELIWTVCKQALHSLAITIKYIRQILYPIIIVTQIIYNNFNCHLGMRQLLFSKCLIYLLLNIIFSLNMNASSSNKISVMISRYIKNIKYIRNKLYVKSYRVFYFPTLITIAIYVYR